MALILKDRVKETTASTGTGNITLAGAVAGFQSFSEIGDANTTYYAIVDSVNNTWEVGIGTYTASGTVLSRDTVLESSNAGAKVSFAAGTKEVFVTYPAEKASTIDRAETLTNKTLTDPAITGTILEDVYTETTASATLTIDPANGSIQAITLGQNATSVVVSGFAAGEAVTLMIADGTAYTITWSTSVTWVGGSAPTLATSGYTVVELWKLGSTVYGAIVGDVA